MQTDDTGASPQAPEILRGVREDAEMEGKKDFHGLKTDFRGYDGSSRILASNCSLQQTGRWLAKLRRHVSIVGGYLL